LIRLYINDIRTYEEKFMLKTSFTASSDTHSLAHNPQSLLLKCHEALYNSLSFISAYNT